MWKERILKCMGIKKKVPQEPGVIGFYDSKPFHNFKYALIYANETLISESDDEKTASVIVYSRVFKGTTFVNVLVYKEEGFDPALYTYDVIKPKLIEKGVEATDKSIVMILFQHYNEQTIALAKKFCKSDKYNFEQACIYNAKKIQMDFYKPVPKFYKLYDHMCENMYFDLAFIDDKRD